MAAISKSVNPDEVDVINKPNSRFKNYKSVFENLLKTNNVKTMYPVVNALITYDATRILMVTKSSDKCYLLKQYGLDSM